MSRILKIKHYFVAHKSQLWLLIPIFISFVIFLSNAFYTSYPDEFDNILGGRYIVQGLIPYKDFFSHHGPGAYYLASIVQILSGISFVRFRVIYEILLFGITWLGFYWLRKKYHIKVNYYIASILLLALSASYFWTHMLLADSLAGWLFLPLYTFLSLSLYYQEKITLKDLGIISLLTFSILITAFTYSFLILFVYLVAFIKYLQSNKEGLIKKLISFAVVMAIPYVIYCLFLLISGSLTDFYYQAINYNTSIYIYNYDVTPGKTINPIRYAISIAVTFQGNFSALLISAKNFNLDYPLNPWLAVGNISLIVLAIFERQYLLALFIWASMIFSNVRSNPYNSKETDYQMGVYLIFSLANAVFVMKELYAQLSKTLHNGKKIIYGGLILFCSLYAFFGVTFLFNSYMYKVYDRYMGKAPLIYDRPAIAPYLNRVITNNDYMWIGPFEFEELYYAKGKLPSNINILIPGMAKSERLQKQMLDGFTKNMPKLIYFDKNFFVLGSHTAEYGKFFVDFLDKNYITPYKASEGKIKYRSVDQVTERVDLEAKLYIPKDEFAQMMQKLVDVGIFKTASESGKTSL